MNKDHISELALSMLPFLLSMDNLSEQKKLEGLGRILFLQNDFEAALRFFNKALESGCNSILKEKAYCHKELKQYKESIQSFDSALEIGQIDCQSWIFKAECHHNLNEIEEEIKALDSALKLEPENAYCWGFKGNALRMQGKFEEAIMHCNKCLELDPKEKSFLTLMHECLQEIDNKKKGSNIED